MATTKNLCAQIPIDLHERVSEERERLGQTTSEYIANLIQDYYNMMENQKGGIQMTEKGRTMAFQILSHRNLVGECLPQTLLSAACPMQGHLR